VRGGGIIAQASAEHPINENSEGRREQEPAWWIEECTKVMHAVLAEDGVSKRMIRALNEIGYEGPLSVEWEDAAMDREAGAKEAVDFVKQVDFSPSGRAFDEAFSIE
jgi:hypothetical protein